MAPRQGPHRGWLERGTCTDDLKQECPRGSIHESGTTLTGLFGVGPIIACYLIGFSGDIDRFANRDACAAYNGTAPVERSSGGRVVHRVSQRENRRLNHALHLAAICQIRQPSSDGRVYFERKLADGKTKKDAIRSLKRHSATPSTASSSSTPPGPDRRAREGTQERLCRPAWPASILHTGSSDQATPGPSKQRYARRRRAAPARPNRRRDPDLTQRGFERGGTHRDKWLPLGAGDVQAGVRWSTHSVTAGRHG
jgi:Transposase IS116/IS110/IS902 family